VLSALEVIFIMRCAI